MIDGGEIAEMFAELDGNDRLVEALERWGAWRVERYRERMGALLERERIEQRVEHGYRRYTTYRCRCDVCRAANAAHQRTYAKQRRQRDQAFKAKRAQYEAGRRARKRSAAIAEAG